MFGGFYLPSLHSISLCANMKFSDRFRNHFRFSCSQTTFLSGLLFQAAYFFRNWIINMHNQSSTFFQINLSFQKQRTVTVMKQPWPGFQDQQHAHFSTRCSVRYPIQCSLATDNYLQTFIYSIFRIKYLMKSFGFLLSSFQKPFA